MNYCVEYAVVKKTLVCLLKSLNPWATENYLHTSLWHHLPDILTRQAEVEPSEHKNQIKDKNLTKIEKTNHDLA
jgi:hypothetical protein